MAKSLLRKTTLSTILLLTLAFTVALSFMPSAKARTTIRSIAPTSGPIGTIVQLIGNITSENKPYVVEFDGVAVARGNATGYNVSATFSVPNTFAGSHSVRLVDETIGESDSLPFTVLTSYFIEIIDPLEPPKQLQEGDSIAFNVSMTGGEANKTYVANITVQTPTNASYTELIDVNASDIGGGNVTVTYPDDYRDDFPNASTNFTGEYKVFFNTTLANQTFAIGITNSTKYHRFQFVDIKATGYKPNENATVAVSFGGKVIHQEENVTASEGGIIYANWTVPSNASMGTYTVNITSTSPNATSKDPPDIQGFMVPGFDVNITTRNLAEEPVPNVTVQVFEEDKSVMNATSNPEGLAGLKLEIGNYTSKAFFKGEEVGERSINVTGVVALDFYCNLTDLRIVVVAVVDEAEVRIPEVEIYISPEKQTLITDINGTAIIHFLLPNTTYTLNSSRYGMQFNVTIIPNLLVNDNVIAWFNVTIICPTLTLQVNVTNPNANDQPINNAIVKIRESMGGLYYQGNTIDGIATFNCPLGKYYIEVYVNGIKLNETSVTLNETVVNVFVSCNLYGLTVSFKIVDFFGQPISNANVTWQRNGLQGSSLTKSDGLATFSEFIGGNLQMIVYLPGQSQPCTIKTVSVSNSTTIEIKIEKYVVLAGFFIETNQLTTAMMILAIVILVLSIEVYRRKHFKPEKSES